MTRHGEDVGRWLTTQRRDFDRLTDGQRARLAELGVRKAPWARQTPAKTAGAVPSGRGAVAFQAGIQALAQYREREGGGVPGRGHVEELPDGSSHRTGVWVVNQKQRRNRLAPEQLAALAELGIDWAAPAP
ncbi:helicase associated domain-containing protein [Streptomyces sp. NPDC048383]|uniref:helicase associated domain-containing protein n=1 Tax=Streptomyces sp. NPDC048383 TaxID=3155386 RepID=UPI00342AB0C6